MNGEFININHICEQGMTVLGPGLRYGIWTQGCPFNCYNCTSPEAHSIEEHLLVPIEVLVNSILSNKFIEGITISGGEPFIQASKLVMLLKKVKLNNPKLSVIIYTGYLLEELNWDYAEELLALTDVLIDGKYIDSYNDGIGLRGSSNQRVHFITDKLIGYKETFETGIRNLEIYVHNYHQIIIGIPRK